jgi:hypothetical protein
MRNNACNRYSQGGPTAKAASSAREGLDWQQGDPGVPASWATGGGTDFDIVALHDAICAIRLVTGPAVEVCLRVEGTRVWEAGRARCDRKNDD